MDRLWGQAERVPEPSADSRRPGVSWAGALGDRPELHGRGADQQFVKHSVRSLVGVTTTVRDVMDNLPALVMTIAAVALGSLQGWRSSLAPTIARLLYRLMWPRLEVPAERETEPGRKEPASAPG